MSDAFDAYHEWLGVPPDEQPPNPYRLLGISDFEPDPVVIEAAADQRIEHLRAFESGPHAALAARLQQEVAQARLRLLYPVETAASDARPLEQRGSVAVPRPPPQAVPQGPSRHLMLGEYLILEELGRGGMGRVLKAEHRRMKRVVALKVISPAVVKNPAILRRFQREVQAAARLMHPNIVTAFDASESDGVHFLVMEYVDGKDLSAIVREHGRLPIDKAIDFTLQAARGLASRRSRDRDRHRAVRGLAVANAGSERDRDRLGGGADSRKNSRFANDRNPKCANPQLRFGRARGPPSAAYGDARRQLGRRRLEFSAELAHRAHLAGTGG
jgi:hypothetical protein